MLEWLLESLRPGDRVLFLAIPPDDTLERVTKAVTHGVVVAIGVPAEIDRMRRAFAVVENVMFIEAAPHKIPWADGYFTKIVVPSQMPVDAAAAKGEWKRLLAPDGELVHE